MCVIIMAESLFEKKKAEDLLKKREVVMDHYQRAYHVKLRELSNEEIEFYYQKFLELKRYQFAVNK